MKCSPKVSVIVPIYGVEPYIERCVRSLMEQTYTNCEYIFVDDCTPDASVEILKRVLEDYPNRKQNVKIIQNEKNQGLPQTRKHGFQYATGDFVANVDSDDFVEPYYLENMLGMANEDVDLVWCSYLQDDGDGKVEIIDNMPSSRNSKECIISEILSWRIHSSVWSKLVSRKIYEQIAFPKYGYLEDMATTLQTVLLARRIAFCDMASYHYCFNPKSMTYTKGDAIMKRKTKEGIMNLMTVDKALHLSGQECYKIQFFRLLNELKCFVALGIHDTEYRESLLSVCPESVEYPSSNSRPLYHYLMKWATKYKIYFTYDLLNLAKKIKR